METMTKRQKREIINNKKLKPKLNTEIETKEIANVEEQERERQTDNKCNCNQPPISDSYNLTPVTPHSMSEMRKEREERKKEKTERENRKRRTKRQ